jgi:PAS domain S-box-containing protein
MPSGYVVMDRGGLIEDVNRAAQALFGRRDSGLIGRPLPALVTTGRQLVRDAIADARRGRLERVDDLEVEILRRDAPPLAASLTIAVARDERGEVSGLRALLVDVSERKRAEEAARVASAARAADLAKDEFLATLSHELRTPLNAILGWSQILRNEGSVEELAYALQSIERNSLHLNRLVADLLDVSRIMLWGVRVPARLGSVRPSRSPARRSRRRIPLPTRSTALARCVRTPW